MMHWVGLQQDTDAAPVGQIRPNSKPLMLTLSGRAALSAFRIQTTLAQLRQIDSAVEGIAPTFIYFANLNAALDQHETDRLQQLLGCTAVRQNRSDNGFMRYVIPRPGTVSPWSSRATEILRRCGLGSVNRIERGVCWWFICNADSPVQTTDQAAVAACIHDRMTETVIADSAAASALFEVVAPTQCDVIPVLERGQEALIQANTQLGLALTDDEIEALLAMFIRLNRNPSDAEVMMFAQVNSEHCRHKLFNADWIIAGKRQPQSLFAMIRATYRGDTLLSAYDDNAAVMAGYAGSRFFPNAKTRCYQYEFEDVHLVMKVETHNHPTAISPFPGAATGAGGEIRDEAATGRGGKPKAGLSGFAVSNLHIPGCRQPWETERDRPGHIASALEIMLQAPIGAAAYNNEFGRPVLCGYFRTYEQQAPGGERYGYHKPIMLAGGYGMIRPVHVRKRLVSAQQKIIVLGGPAMLIGLGGGAASSVAVGDRVAALDFASVQRGNAEMQRRCQEVIDRCWALGTANPIVSIHDVGAGGLSNAIPELIHAGEQGAVLALSAIPTDEPGMSPMQLWCNESQERYVLCIAAESIPLFRALCERERAPFAVLGETTATSRLTVHDASFANTPIDMPMALLLGNQPPRQRTIRVATANAQTEALPEWNIAKSIRRVLQLPCVADKRFLITIGDRTVGGLSVRDQLVGPWQVAVADCAVTAAGYDSYTGEALAIGEKSPLAVHNAPASGRMAVAEAITNICAARVLTLNDIALSANWMAACGDSAQDLALYQTVKAVKTFCIELGIAIPVGKDSLAMTAVFEEQGKRQTVKAPVSLNVSAFARVADIRRTLTPQLCCTAKDTLLVLIDLGMGRNRLAGSALLQVYNRIGATTPDIDDSRHLQGFFQAIQILNESETLLAYHDRSDGGLLATVCEMAFAGRTGVDITIEPNAVANELFNEEAGAVIQIEAKDFQTVQATCMRSGLPAACVKKLGTPNTDLQLRIYRDGELVYNEALLDLHRIWSRTSYAMQSLRDNPECAQEEYDQIRVRDDSGLSMVVTFEPDAPASVYLAATKPRIAILREQGVNGQVEMAAAFDRAGFECVDVHMQDIISREVDLNQFKGLAACGGFSYGDVLGAGSGWAQSILLHPQTSDAFQHFFERDDTFTLGVCNGCQMLSQLRPLIPGADHWPTFTRNRSEQFESRLSMVEVVPSASMLLTNMVGSRLPVVVAHGEGRVDLAEEHAGATEVQLALRFIDHHGRPAETYPQNPNGSAQGMTGFTSADGRVTIMMPHPERVFLTKQLSWCPADWHDEYSPWMQLFINARKWLN